MGDDLTVDVAVPVDYQGNTIDHDLIYKVVHDALYNHCSVVLNHVWTVFNTFRAVPSRETALALAAIALRYAQEHQ